MFDWNNPNSVYVFTAIMTNEDADNKIVTTAAWTIGFWDSLIDEIKANFDEIFVYTRAKERNKLLLDIKTPVDDITPYYGGPILLSPEIGKEIEAMCKNNTQTKEKIEGSIKENTIFEFQAQVNEALDKKDEKSFQQIVKNYLSFLEKTKQNHQ